MLMQRVIVSGLVQGVNFRHFVAVEANRRNLAKRAQACEPAWPMDQLTIFHP